MNNIFISFLLTIKDMATRGESDLTGVTTAAERATVRFFRRYNIHSRLGVTSPNMVSSTLDELNRERIIARDNALIEQARRDKENF